MAKANSTRSTSTARAPKDEPQSIVKPTNPLFADIPEDTIRNVHSVLTFLSMATLSMAEQGAFEIDIADEVLGNGLNMIITTCAAALAGHLYQEGGAP